MTKKQMILVGNIFSVVIFAFLINWAKAADDPVAPPTTLDAQNQVTCCQWTKGAETFCAMMSKSDCDKKKTEADSKVIIEDSVLTCYDEFYQEVTGKSQTGVICREKVNFDLTDKQEGVVSNNCLSVNSGINIKECLKSAFFPSTVGLPGSENASAESGMVKNKLLAYLALIINLVLGFLGIIFIIIIIYAGIEWLLAADNETKIDEQKERLRNAVIGLCITLMAYGISYFIFSVLSRAAS
jgi:hypothetical protein